MRTATTTQKIETAFGSMYVHLERDSTGRPVGISFSTPGKCDNTQLDGIIKQLGEAANSLLESA